MIHTLLFFDKKCWFILSGKSVIEIQLTQWAFSAVFCKQLFGRFVKEKYRALIFIITYSNNVIENTSNSISSFFICGGGIHNENVPINVQFEELYLIAIRGFGFKLRVRNCAFVFEIFQKTSNIFLLPYWWVLATQYIFFTLLRGMVSDSGNQITVVSQT